MLITLPKQKLYVNGPVLKEFKTITGETKKCYLFYTSLGKGKGYITCKCWDLKHDLTRLKTLDRVTCDLKSYKRKDGSKAYELVIVNYAEPLLSDWIVDTKLPVKNQPLKENIVDVNSELPPLEEFADLEKEQLNNVINNYKKEK